MTNRTFPRARWRVLVLSAASIGVLAASATPTGGTFTASIANTTNIVGTRTYFSCTSADTGSATGPAALLAYGLNDPTGSTTAADLSGHGSTGNYYGPMISTPTTSRDACPRDQPGAYAPDGVSSIFSDSHLYPAPNTFTEEIWFASTATDRGIMGMSSSRSVPGTAFDRQTYITPAGTIAFGVWTGAITAITSPDRYADGNWHLVDASLSTAGMRLYVDGALVASGPRTTGSSYSGYWRAGWGGWGSTGYFRGRLRFFSVYDIALTPPQILAHYQAGIP